MTAEDFTTINDLTHGGREINWTLDCVPARLVLNPIRADRLVAGALPPREWLVDGMIPANAVTLLYGDGGVGKSLLGLQLAVACVARMPWCGAIPSTGRALYVSCEDDRDELHRRLADTLAGYNLEPQAVAALDLLDLVDTDTVMGETQPGRRRVGPTPLFEALASLIATRRPALVVVDSVANAFVGNENDRSEVRQFVSLFTRLAARYRTSILLLAHPSREGMRNGTGDGASTAWSNSVRSRLFLDRVMIEKKEPDPALRRLTVMKSNYGAAGREVKLRYGHGFFATEHAGADFLDRLADEAKAEEVFLALLNQTRQQGRRVSPNPCSTYAPTVFAAMPNAGGFGKESLRAAMERLFAARKIRIVTTGPASKERAHIE